MPDNKNKNKSDLVCTCNDEFATKPCPIHHKDKKILRDLIITDELLVPEEVRQWTGLTFICPSCGEPSIMDFMGYCPSCGSKLKIQSRKLTELIRKSEQV